MFSILAGLLVIRQVVKGKIYVGCDKTERHSESFYTTVKLAFTTTEVETETSAKLALATTKVDTETSALLNGRFRKPYNLAKFLKVLCALIVLNFVAIRTTEKKVHTGGDSSDGTATVDDPLVYASHGPLHELSSACDCSGDCLVTVTSDAPLGVISCDFESRVVVTSANCIICKQFELFQSSIFLHV